MNQENQLRHLIRESIQEYIREIDEAGNRAALEAKMTKTQEAIDARKKKLNMEGLDEAYHDMMDKGKMKEMTSEIKMLEKSLAKYGKMLEKMDAKNAPKMEEMEDKDVEEEMIDEVSIDENDPESGPQLEEETEQVYEMLLMQKRAGIISETEYRIKVEEAKKKASAGLTKKQKSAISKKAHAGKDIGKKGKGFEKVAKAGEKQYGSKEAGEKVAAAAMWKNAAKKAKSLKEEVQALFEDDMLNEDILELKQMSKQLYSFLKQKGFSPLLQSKLETGKSSKTGDGENIAQIIVSDKPDERVTVAVSAPSVAKAIVGGGDDWNHKATQKFGQNITSNAMNASGNWFKNPEIIKYVDGLGNEILKQIFAKYPNMEYGFSQQDGFWYILQFRFKKTAKGGTANPNQRPNAPKPTVSELFGFGGKKAKGLKEEVQALFEDGMTEGRGQGTTVGKLLNMISSIPSNAFISLNYDGSQGTKVRALNYVDMEGLDGLASGEPEIILVGETNEDHMTVGELKTQLSKLDPSTYVTLNLDLENGTKVVTNIKIDDEGLDGLASGEPEIILYGS